MKASPILIFEIQHFSNAIRLLDKMSKLGDVQVVHAQKALGGRLITIVLSGELSLLKACHEYALNMFSNSKLLKVIDTIPSPGTQLIDFLNKGGQV